MIDFNKYKINLYLALFSIGVFIATGYFSLSAYNASKDIEKQHAYHIKVIRQDIDKLGFPAWDLFPIKNYWKLVYSHAPIKESYLPLLTSRGCPYNCEFCITPKMFGRIWRGRNAKNVVDEMEDCVSLGIKEILVYDDTFTVDKQRVIDICRHSSQDIVFSVECGTVEQAEYSLQHLKSLI